MSVTKDILTKAVGRLRTDEFYFRRVSDRWITGETFVKAIKALRLIDPSLSFDARVLNTLLSKHSEWKTQCACYDDRNRCGINQAKFGKNPGIFWYLRAEGTSILNPTLCADWRNAVLASQAAICESLEERPRSTRSREAARVSLDNNTANATNDTSDVNNSHVATVFCQVDEQESSPAKRQRTERAAEIESLKNQSVWDSPEAFKLFHPTEEDESPRDAIKCRIQKLSTVLQYARGYENVLEGGDPDKACTESEVFFVRQKCMCLRTAHSIALDDWHWENKHGRTWQDCCVEALKRVNSVGYSWIRNHETIMRWNADFRQSDFFPHPNPHAQLGKKPEPRMLSKFPELKEKITDFCLANLGKLTLDLVRDEITSKIMPSIHAAWAAEQRKIPINKRELPELYLSYDGFLYLHHLTTISPATVWRWVHYIGFRYSERRKSYYVDGHERDDVVKKRIEYCLQYLLEDEPRCLQMESTF